MAHETRVNLKHLLEDIRDAYSATVEEVIVTELAANALDSGATEIKFSCDPSSRTFMCVDNGKGMKREELKRYHDIAASIKDKGEGIGFAGIGAKLSLLLAEKVITETRGGKGSQNATEWYLQNLYKAPWKFVPFSGRVSTSRGTAVALVLRDVESPLLRPGFIRKTLEKHFFPLVCEGETNAFLGKIYKKPARFFVSGEMVAAKEPQGRRFPLKIFLGTGRKAVGVGFVVKIDAQTGLISSWLGGSTERPPFQGLVVSTYGKIIKQGWEWAGITPKYPEMVFGVVEVPALAHILTTNKSDFLSDPRSLKIYYSYRKAIQKAVQPALLELGAVEAASSNDKPPVEISGMAKDIEGALAGLVSDYPVLDGLVGEHSKTVQARTGKKAKVNQKKKMGDTENLPTVDAMQTEREFGLVSSGVNARTREHSQSGSLEVGVGDKLKRIKTPGIKIVLESLAGEDATSLGKLVNETVVINSAHSAWQEAVAQSQVQYYALMVISLVLGEQISGNKELHEFVSKFFSGWTEARARSGKLF